jgi:hypothetical protein
MYKDNRACNYMSKKIHLVFECAIGICDII